MKILTSVPNPRHCCVDGTGGDRQTYEQQG